MKLSLLFVVGSLFCGVAGFAESNNPSSGPVLSAGMHAITIGASRILDSDVRIKPGDHVDLLGTYRDPRINKTVTRVIVRNLLVLAWSRRPADPSRKDFEEQALVLAVPTYQTELVTAGDRSDALSIVLAEEEPPCRSGTTTNTIRQSDGLQTNDIIMWDKLHLLNKPAPVGDFWLPGEYEKQLEEKKARRQENGQ